MVDFAVLICFIIVGMSPTGHHGSSHGAGDGGRAGRHVDADGLLGGVGSGTTERLGTKLQYDHIGKLLMIY